ncbi:Alpha/Beta hydrolase protein [Plectosphaerella plurivora]|uniref:Alpha/Beta hydrolase protein n=1 Tax=Plectosphaerella plurivora TaxID=936078 RepID=A0A9P8VDE5_9PEZI|nr:Alpha/Beta hydrolase protein [Plectosphaerella plurivora]
MVLLKPIPEYVDLGADFTPLPKHGHLSEKHPSFAAIEAPIGAAFSSLWALPDFIAFREAAGDPDAAMPAGGPDRYKDVVTELINFNARDGHQLELKVYKSPKVEPNATLMYRMHGGGWCVGSHEVDGVENVHAATNPRIVVYQRAPEFPFPYGPNDSYDGLMWCRENSDFLGIDPEKIILSGSSAGANLAACLAIQCRDEGIPGIVAQVLHFPPTSHPKYFPRDKYDFGSYIQNSNNPVLSTLWMEAFYDAYIAEHGPDHRHSPLLTPSLEGLPPTLIQCGGADILRDDAFAYAEALSGEGNDVEFFVYKGLPHCFTGLLLDIPETKQFHQRYNSFLDRHT